MQQMHRTSINHKGHIENTKYVKNTWLLIMNPNSFQPGNKEKTNMIIKSYQDQAINRILSSEVSTK